MMSLRYSLVLEVLPTQFLVASTATATHSQVWSGPLLGTLEYYCGSKNWGEGAIAPPALLALPALKSTYVITT